MRDTIIRDGDPAASSRRRASGPVPVPGGAGAEGLPG